MPGATLQPLVEYISFILYSNKSKLLVKIKEKRKMIKIMEMRFNTNIQLYSIIDTICRYIYLTLHFHPLP